MFKPAHGHVITAPFTVRAPENLAAQRFCQRLGTSLLPTLVALWAPEAQRAMLDS